MSLKKNIIIKITNILSDESLRNHRLILTTSGGTISGYICLDDDLDNDESVDSSLALICDKAYSERAEELNLSDDECLPNDEGYLILKDVEILAASTISLPNMIVFFNDIIGVSFGKYE